MKGLLLVPLLILITAFAAPLREWARIWLDGWRSDRGRDGGSGAGHLEFIAVGGTSREDTEAAELCLPGGEAWHPRVVPRDAGSPPPQFRRAVTLPRPGLHNVPDAGED